MPLEFVGLLEALLTAFALAPTYSKDRYCAVACETLNKMSEALNAATMCGHLEFTATDLKAFKASKATLVKLISNPPTAGFEPHESLKPILTAVIGTSRAISTGSLTKREAEVLVQQLQAYVHVHQVF